MGLHRFSLIAVLALCSLLPVLFVNRPVSDSEDLKAQRDEWLHNERDEALYKAFFTSTSSEDTPRTEATHGVESIGMTRSVGASGEGGEMLSQSDFIYRHGTWDGSPIVIEDYKLLFFTTPKVGCTVWKQLFRRIGGKTDWKKTVRGGVPHDPQQNGLTYLSRYTPDKAMHMLTSPEWTRAIFVRDPLERFLSAYLDKALLMDGQYIRNKCCPDKAKCVKPAQTSLLGFLKLAKICKDVHWMPQSSRMEASYWEYINFVGHMENAEKDAKLLLEKVGAYADFGQTGWGANGDESLFASAGNIIHETKAHDMMERYYGNDDETRNMVVKLYVNDYNKALFGFDKPRR